MARAGMMLDCRIDLHIFQGGTMTAVSSMTEIIEPYVRCSKVELFPGLFYEWPVQGYLK